MTSSFPTAEIIAVGSELLTPSKVDTNSLHLTDQLNALGIEVALKTIVGDDRPRLTEVVQAGLRRSTVILVTGGLGPTEDDVTRDAVAAALGCELVFSEEAFAAVEDRFRRAGRLMHEINRRQAYCLNGADLLPNARGTAPGQWAPHPGGVVVLLPGPPNELKPLFAEQVLPRLQAMLPPQAIRTRFYRVTGMAEADLDALIAPVTTRYVNPTTTVLAGNGDLQVHLRARAATDDDAERLVDEVGRQVEPLLADRLYSRDGSDLETTVVRQLAACGETLAVAESVTGGLVAQRLTSVPGASQVFVGGFLAYTDAVKHMLLGVDQALLAEHSAVSEPVARAMAEGARTRTGASYALALTGYAGPDGGTERDPVGTVHVALATPSGTNAMRYRLPGDRTRIRIFAAQGALDFLRRHLALSS